MSPVRVLALVFLLELVGIHVPAGEAVASNDQLWLGYTHRRTMAPHWELQGDAGYRTVTSADIWTRANLQSDVRWHPTWNPFEVRGGLGAYYTFQNGTSNLFELRPWVGGALKWPRIGRATLVSLLRLEDRIEWQTDGGPADSTLRLRYKLSTKLPLEKEHGERYFFIPVSFEAFAGPDAAHPGQTAQKVRADLGIGLVYSYDWVAELRFGIQNSRSDQQSQFERNSLVIEFTVTRLATRDYMATSR